MQSENYINLYYEIWGLNLPRNSIIARIYPDENIKDHLHRRLFPNGQDLG